MTGPAPAQRGARTGSPRGVLHILNSHGGGTERHVLALIEATRTRHRHHVAIAAGDHWQVEAAPDDGTVRTFDSDRPPDGELASLSRRNCGDVRNRPRSSAQHLGLPRGSDRRARRTGASLRLHGSRPRLRLPDDHPARRRRDVLRRRDGCGGVHALSEGAARVRDVRTSCAGARAIATSSRIARSSSRHRRGRRRCWRATFRDTRSS